MKAGVVSVGCAYTHTSTTDMELIGMAGFDFVYLDGEHGTFSLDDLDNLVRVAEMYDVTTWARAPTSRPRPSASTSTAAFRASRAPTSARRPTPSVS